MILLASLGGTLEFYDFVIFGVFARDIAAAVFPATDPIVSLILSFATFAVGYLARPIGGIQLITIQQQRAAAKRSLTLPQPQ